MSARIRTTILLILLVLVSAASGVYHLKSRQEIEALQQRITELTRKLSQSRTQPTVPQTDSSRPVPEATR
ncbi:MAG: hypothetical protein ABFS45_22285 [Pseudomonadota bacterium]